MGMDDNGRLNVQMYAEVGTRASRRHAWHAEAGLPVQGLKLAELEGGPQVVPSGSAAGRRGACVALGKMYVQAVWPNAKVAITFPRGRGEGARRGYVPAQEHYATGSQGSLG